MGSRSRSMTFVEPTGSHRWVSQDSLHIVSSGIDSTTTLQGTKLCADVTGPRPYTDHSLDLTTSRIIRPRYSAKGATFVGDICTWKGDLVGWRPGDFLSPYGLPNLPSKNWSYYTTLARANINPSTPVVDLPLFLFELKDFPRMLRGLGNALGKPRSSDIPDSYLAYSFGWAPLVSDLLKLLSLADQIAHRKKLLLDASKKGGTRVKRRLAKRSLSSADTTDSTSRNGCTIARLRWKWVGSEEWWFTARLTIKPGSIPVDLDTAAFRSVLGLNFSMATLWNMLPWSWLIDYFINFGGYLAANRGYIHHSVSRLNIMCHQTLTSRSSSYYLNPGVSVREGTKTVEYKGRRVGSPVPKLALTPFLTGGMIANLSALATSKALKSSL